MHPIWVCTRSGWSFNGLKISISNSRVSLMTSSNDPTSSYSSLSSYPFLLAASRTELKVTISSFSFYFFWDTQVGRWCHLLRLYVLGRKRIQLGCSLFVITRIIFPIFFVRWILYLLILRHVLAPLIGLFLFLVLTATSELQFKWDYR